MGPSRYPNPLKSASRGPTKGRGGPGTKPDPSRRRASIQMNKWGITAKLLLVPIVSVALLALAIAFTAFTQNHYESVARLGVGTQTSKARHYAAILDELAQQHAQYLDLATARLAGATGPKERKGLNALLGSALDLNADLDAAALDADARDGDGAQLVTASKLLSDFQDVVARLSLERSPEQIRADVVQSNDEISRINATLASLLANARVHGDAAFRDLESEVRRSLTILAVVMVLVGTLAIMLTVWARRAITRPLGAVAVAMRHFREDANTPLTIQAESRDEVGEIVAGFNELVASVQQRERALTASTAQLRDGNLALQSEVRDRRSAEEQLLRSRELLEAAQSAGGIGVFDLDLDDHLLRGSGQFFQLQGLNPGAEVMHQDQWLALVHPDDLEILIGAFTSAVAAGGAYRVEYRIQRVDRTIRWVTSAGRVVVGEGPAARRIVGSLMDITERKQSELALRDAEARLARAVRGTSDGLFEHDVTRQRIWFAPRVAELLGYAPSDFASSVDAFEELVHPEDRALRAEALTSHLERGTTYDIEFRVLDVAREWQWIRSRAQANRDATADSIILSGSLQLVTDRRQQAAELERARRAAEDANLAKSQFLANMSHEIRTPINGVIGMTHVLLDSPLADAQRECVEILKSSGEALLALINDILDVSKVEAGKLELEEIELDVRAVVDDALGAIAMTALGKDLEVAAHVAADVPYRLRGDPGRLRQCLVNLLGNAVKFTPQGEVTVETELIALEGAAALLRFTVADTGIGIATDRLDRLFQQFSQVDASTTRHFGGSGLGLSIVKRLAALMGGDVGVSSTPGAGSRFWFTVRLEASPIAAPAVTPRHVLVLESNATAGAFLVRQLGSLGHAASYAATAEELERTLAALPSGSAAVAIIDGRLRDADPLAVAARCRALPEPPALVLLCRLGEAPTRPPAGIDAVLTKPVRSLQLLTSLERLNAAPRAAATGGRVDAATGAPHAAWRVLLVEDNAVNRRVAEHQLTRLGCVVGIATNGVEAIAAVAEGAWDLVLMDCQMPILDGFDATREIRAQERPGTRLPIVALTANALSGDREACLAAGMDDFLSKPIAPAALAACVERWATHAAAGANEAARPAAAAAPAAAARVAAGDPPVDLVALDELTDGDAGFQCELIDVFIASGDTTLAALLEALRVEDLPAVRRYAHSLKGASANLRARPLAARALVIEEAAAAGNLADCRSASVALAEDYRVTSEYIGARRAALA